MKNLIPYKPDHARAIIDERIRKHDLWLTEVPGCEQWPLEWAKHPAYTLVINKEIILCGGVMLLHYRCGEAWTLFADNYRKYPIACYKACKWVLDKVAKDYNLRRIQAIVEPDVNGGRRFTESLGFQEEGLLRSLGPNGEDFYMFARIIGER